MIYTVGSKKAYFRALLKNGKVIKSGRKRGYAGGCVFRTREDARQHIDELELQGSTGKKTRRPTRSIGGTIC
jgi:hypothetical protein